MRRQRISKIGCLGLLIGVASSDLQSFCEPDSEAMNEPILVAHDPGHADMSAWVVFQKRNDAIVVLDFAVDEMKITIEKVHRKLWRTVREQMRPKGYSQSHWRKIYRQMSPYSI
jgi:hypothetical protein